jgi:thioredoxin-like negative regulator of GroEL
LKKLKETSYKEEMYKSYGDYHSPSVDLPSQKYSYDLMSAKDFEHALQRVEVIIVDAWAPWCQPCKKLSARFEQLGEKFHSFLEAKRLLLLKDNIDDEDRSYHRLSVKVVPTFFVYIRGKLHHVWTGIDFKQVEDFLVSYFSQTNTTPSVSTPSVDQHYQHTQQQSPQALPQIKKNIHYPPKNI